MKTETSKIIIDYISKKGESSAAELADYLNITPRAVFKQLKFLIDNKRLSKIGRPPKVFYIIYKYAADKVEYYIDPAIKSVIDEHFLLITPAGEAKEGMEGFSYWCKKFKLEVEKTASEYFKTIKKYAVYKKHGLIDGMHKIKSTFKEVFVDELFYLDFYAIERFGKTKLGQYLLYAKQSQDRKQISLLIKNIKPQVDKIIADHLIDGVGFIPPTVKREVQLMKELQKKLHLGVKKVSIVKIKTPIIIPQKTLNKLNDRIENARNTIIVDENDIYNNILLIDDAIGSGATINETARQIREKNICKGKIIALAITGSFKGFDVISEI